MAIQILIQMILGALILTSCGVSERSRTATKKDAVADENKDPATDGADGETDKEEDEAAPVSIFNDKYFIKDAAQGQCNLELLQVWQDLYGMRGPCGQQQGQCLSKMPTNISKGAMTVGLAGQDGTVMVVVLDYNQRYELEVVGFQGQTCGSRLDVKTEKHFDIEMHPSFYTESELSAFRIIRRSAGEQSDAQATGQNNSSSLSELIEQVYVAGSR